MSDDVYEIDRAHCIAMAKHSLLYRRLIWLDHKVSGVELDKETKKETALWVIRWQPYFDIARRLPFPGFCR